MLTLVVSALKYPFILHYKPGCFATWDTRTDSPTPSSRLELIRCSEFHIFHKSYVLPLVFYYFISAANLDVLWRKTQTQIPQPHPALWNWSFVVILTYFGNIIQTHERLKRTLFVVICCVVFWCCYRPNVAKHQNNANKTAQSKADKYSTFHFHRCTVVF